MALIHWSRNSGILVAAIFAVGGFLVGSSSSQEATTRGTADGEVGRYQMMAAHANDLKIIDTKTGRYWQRLTSETKERWDERPGPLGGGK